MKLTLPAASLLALSLFAGPVMAQDQPLMQVAQAAVPAKVQAYLDDQTPLAELTIPQLTQRIRQGRALMQTKNLPKDARQQIRGIMQAAGKERQARQSASAQATEGTAQPQVAEGAPETQVAQAEPDAPAGDTQAAPGRDSGRRRGLSGRHAHRRGDERRRPASAGQSRTAAGAAQGLAGQYPPADPPEDEVRPGGHAKQGWCACDRQPRLTLRPESRFSRRTRR